MSECQIKRNFCMTHKCWVAKEDDPRCPMSELAAEVERLRAEVERLTAEHSEAVALGERLLVSAADWKVRAQSAEAEVGRLTAALAESEGHSATLSKQLDRANMLRINALNELREQTKVTIDQGVALSDRDRRIEAALAAIDRYYRDGDGIGVVVGVEDALRGYS